MLAILTLLAAASAPHSLMAFDQVGPCHGAPCPTADIVVCHNPSTGNTGATITDYGHNPPGIRHYGLGMGSTKKLYAADVTFFPCGNLTWSDVMSCDDIWFMCTN